MKSITGKPIVGVKKTCDCGRQAVLQKWGETYVCSRCHQIETDLYTVGSKWDPTYRRADVQSDREARLV